MSTQKLAAATLAALLVGASALVAQAAPARAPDDVGAILVFHKTVGYAHPSIPDGVAAIKKLGADHHFTVDDTVDPAAFTAANLAKYKAVVFLDTTGDVLPNVPEREALQAYIHSGGGYFGIHAAADMGAVRNNWPWYRDLLGAAFKGHTGSRIYSDTPLGGGGGGAAGVVLAGKFADAPTEADLAAPGVKAISWEPARIVVDDLASPMVAGWGPSVTRSDEWYGFATNPRSKVHVIASLDEKSYTPAGGQMGDHPIAWCQSYDGGRSVYTGLGHPKAAWTDAQMLGHVLAGIELAAGSIPFKC